MPSTKPTLRKKPNKAKPTGITDTAHVAELEPKPAGKKDAACVGELKPTRKQDTERYHVPFTKPAPATRGIRKHSGTQQQSFTEQQSQQTAKHIPASGSTLLLTAGVKAAALGNMGVAANKPVKPDEVDTPDTPATRVQPDKVDNTDMGTQKTAFGSTVKPPVKSPLPTPTHQCIAPPQPAQAVPAAPSLLDKADKADRVDKVGTAPPSLLSQCDGGQPINMGKLIKCTAWQTQYVLDIHTSHDMGVLSLLKTDKIKQMKDLELDHVATWRYDPKVEGSTTEGPEDIDIIFQGRLSQFFLDAQISPLHIHRLCLSGNNVSPQIRRVLQQFFKLTGQPFSTAIFQATQFDFILNEVRRLYPPICSIALPHSRFMG